MTVTHGPYTRVLLQSPAYRYSDKRTYRYIFFPPQIFRRPWADFRETATRRVVS